MFARKSLSGAHDEPPSVVFQMPPAAAAAYITFASVGLMSSERVRPPTLPGPNDCQVPRAPLVEALPSPAPPPPVPFGNSPSSPLNTSLRCMLVCASDPANLRIDACRFDISFFWHFEQENINAESRIEVEVLC